MKLNGRGVAAAKLHIEAAFRTVQNELASEISVTRPRTRPLAEVAAPILQVAERHVRAFAVQPHSQAPIVITEPTETAEVLFELALLSLRSNPDAR